MGPMSNVLYPVGMPVFEQIIDEGRRYVDKTSLEGHYTAMLYVIFMLVGLKTQSQVRTADGLIDMLMTLTDRNYLIELKLDGTAQAALNQIDSKDYALAVSNTLPTTKVGINFSTETGTVTDWIISE